MLKNFNEVTPKAPTQLPIDYDHLSMDPKKPGDGIAAGWMEKLELRGDGDELWGEVSWTPDGAERIRNLEYRFISPSFVKDHTHKTGQKIGTTLLAAAVTNHPFLEGMKALTLFNFSTMGDLALNSDHVAKPDDVISLAEVGQRVMIAPGNARTQDEIGGTFEIAEVIGEGDDAFVSLKDAAGLVHKWFRATELLPASSTPANSVHPQLQPGQTPVVPSQLPQVPVQPITQSTDPAGAAKAAAATALGIQPGVDPNAPIDPNATPNAPNAAAAANSPGADAKANPFAAKKDGEDGGPKKDGAKPDGEGATGGDDPLKDPIAAAAAAAGVVPPEGAKPDAKKPGDNPFAAKGDKKDDGKDGDKKDATPAAPAPGVVPGAVPGAVPVPGAPVDPMAELLKKTVAGLFATATPKKGIAHMMFKLRNDKNEEVNVSMEQLEAAGLKVAKDGETIIAVTDLTSMKGQITSLSTVVDALKTENETNAKNARSLELATMLDGKVRGGFMSKAQRDKFFELYKDAADLTAIKAVVDTFTTSIVSLNREHGTAADVDSAEAQGDAAQKEIIALAATIQKERGVSLSDAVKLAGAQLAEKAETYRESFALIN